MKMKHYPDPKLLVNQDFKDIELFSRAVNWDLDFRQIDHGPLTARAMAFGHDDIFVFRVEFNRSFHQIGRPLRVAAMNRAVEILGNYNQFPINIEALCTMAGASWATLQRAFAEEFGVTPSSYIKSRRLAAVQSELIKAGHNAIISDVANRWGFWHMGSFASDYRKQFGELPSETLRRLELK